MPDELTRKEIEEALKLCQHDTTYCIQCPCYTRGCIKTMSENVLNHIYSQDEEIKRLSVLAGVKKAKKHKGHKEKNCFLNHTILHIVIHLLFHLLLHLVLVKI